ncbi:MAG: hypothetical protein JO250_10735 [Armatimonadetes bacterium]|nr:hypothetical protein [Armatimonadota bacterium]
MTRSDQSWSGPETAREQKGTHTLEDTGRQQPAEQQHTKKPSGAGGVGMEEVMHTAEMQSIPIDFAGLIRAGVIERRGPWYKVHRWEDLPEHARAQISDWKSGQEMVVRFHRPTKKLKASASPSQSQDAEQEPT